MHCNVYEYKETHREGKSKNNDDTLVLEDIERCAAQKKKTTHTHTHRNYRQQTAVVLTSGTRSIWTYQ
jgi:hypothetical protein